jgi:hypothetical protein
MFRKKVAAILKIDNPISNINKPSPFNEKELESFIDEKDGKIEQRPDFSKFIKEKSLTKSENYDTMSFGEEEKAELEALKLLIKKYKGESHGG